MQRDAGAWAPALLLASCLGAAVTPALSKRGADAAPPLRVPAWPAHLQGQLLHALPLGEREAAFARDFPGATARFTDGQNDIVMRWVTQPTRRLHPAEDCYRALGYSVAQTHIVLDGNHSPWRCFAVNRAHDAHEVCEQIADGDGRHWSDVSAWYWDAAFNHSSGPWLVTTAAR